MSWKRACSDRSLSFLLNLVDLVSDCIGKLFHLAFLELQALLLEEIHDVVTRLFTLFGSEEKTYCSLAL